MLRRGPELINTQHLTGHSNSRLCSTALLQPPADLFQAIFVFSLQAEVDPKVPETEPSESEDVLDELSIKVASKVVNLVRRFSVWDIGLNWNEPWALAPRAHSVARS